MERKPFHTRYTVTITGCWEWNGVRSPKGYGVAKDLRRPGKLIRAHRLSYELHVEPIPRGMLVIHSCDNPACVRPSHLRLGTQKDNMADARARGRLKNPGARLTEEQVRQIRASSESLTVLAARFGCGRANISHIRTRRNWRGVQ